jgi:hypothetical protein
MAAKKKPRKSKPAKKPVARKPGTKKSVAKKTTLVKTLVKKTVAKSTRVEKQSGKKSGTRSGKKSPTTGPKLARAVPAGLGVADIGAREVRDEGGRVEVGPGDAQASLQAAQREYREFQLEAKLDQLVTQVVTAVTGPFVEGLAGLLGVVEGLRREIVDIKNRLPPQEPAAGSGRSQPTPEAHARQETDARILNARRDEIWCAETNQKDPLRLPRPTILGRAIRDAARRHDRSDISQTKRGIFALIKACGLHHLSNRISQLVETKGKRAASRLDKLYTVRCRRLVKPKIAAESDGGFQLTRYGRRLFNGWPDWDVADDDEECLGRLELAEPRRPSTPVPAEPQTGGQEGGDTGVPR